MEDKEIIEGNRLIAEFIGAEPHGDDWFDKTKTVIFKKEELPLYAEDYANSKNLVKGIIFCIENLRYHLSWDWLIPVVEKIESLTYRFTISTTFVRVHTCKKSWDDTDEYHTGVFEGKLNTTWYAVVEFIKWHNSQTATAITLNENKK